MLLGIKIWPRRVGLNPLQFHKHFVIKICYFMLLNFNMTSVTTTNRSFLSDFFWLLAATFPDFICRLWSWSSSVSSCRVGVVEDLFCALILYHEPKIHTWCNFSSSRQVYTWALESLIVYTCEKSYMYIKKSPVYVKGPRTTEPPSPGWGSSI